MKSKGLHSGPASRGSSGQAPSAEGWEGAPKTMTRCRQGLAPAPGGGVGWGGRLRARSSASCRGRRRCALPANSNQQMQAGNAGKQTQKGKPKTAHKHEGRAAFPTANSSQKMQQNKGNQTKKGGRHPPGIIRLTTNMKGAPLSRTLGRKRATCASGCGVAARSHASSRKRPVPVCSRSQVGGGNYDEGARRACI